MPRNTSTNMNYDTLAEQLTPTAIRKPVLLAFIKALLAPIKGINTHFNSFVANKRQRMSYNGQVRLLENIINRLMIGSYDADSPVIYLSEPEIVKEFYISPDGSWDLQNSIHYDDAGKQDWDTQNNDPVEPPEDYSMVFDQSKGALSFGFEVHLTELLGTEARDNQAKRAFNNNGGLDALKDVVDIYKLAGKQYTVIQD